MAIWGVLASAAMLTLPILLGVYVVKEWGRYHACTADASETGCQPSPLWLFFDEFGVDETMMESVGSKEDKPAGLAETSLEPTAIPMDRPCGIAIGWCAPDAVCKTGTDGIGAGVCAARNDASPFILSFALEGMSLERGMYVGAAGEDVRLILQSVNADTASVITPGGEITLSRNDGVFTGLYTLPKGAAGTMTAVARAGNETSALAVPFVSLD